MSEFRTLFSAAAAFLLLACPARPQAGSLPVFRVDTTVLQVDAVVLDKKGRQVTGLQAGDFVVEEEGRTRPIEYCSYISLTEPRSAPAGQFDDGRLRYEDLRRTFAFVISVPVIRVVLEQRMGPVKQKLFLSPVAEFTKVTADMLDRFLNEQMRPGDLAEIAKVDVDMGILAHLTNDRDLLRAAVAKFRARPLNDTPVVNIERSPTGHWRMDQIVRQNLRVLDIVGQTVEHLRGLPGRKTVVLAGRSLLSAGSEGNLVHEELNRVVEHANQAGVNIHAISLKDLDEGRAGDALARAAGETGGILIENTNGFNEGLDRILEANAGYYLLGYRIDQPEAAKRKIKVRVRQPGLRVQARNSATIVGQPFAPPKIETREQIQAALYSPLALRGLGVVAHGQAKAVGGPQFRISSDILIDVSRIGLKPGAGDREFALDIVTVLLGPKGNLVESQAKRHFFRVSESRLEQFRAEPRVAQNFEWQVDQPGIYQVRQLVRDPKTGLAGNAQCLVKAELPTGKM